jgi:hypothetical protein
MPGIVRKLLIIAAVDSLILQPQGASDNHQSVHINYKSRSIGQHPKVDVDTSKGRLHLESHGIIGQHLTSSQLSSAILQFYADRISI